MVDESRCLDRLGFAAAMVASRQSGHANGWKTVTLRWSSRCKGGVTTIFSRTHSRDDPPKSWNGIIMYDSRGLQAQEKGVPARRMLKMWRRNFRSSFPQQLNFDWQSLLWLPLSWHPLQTSVPGHIHCCDFHCHDLCCSDLHSRPHSLWGHPLLWHPLLWHPLQWLPFQATFIAGAGASIALRFSLVTPIPGHTLFAVTSVHCRGIHCSDIFPGDIHSTPHFSAVSDIRCGDAHYRDTRCSDTHCPDIQSNYIHSSDILCGDIHCSDIRCRDMQRSLRS